MKHSRSLVLLLILALFCAVSFGGCGGSSSSSSGSSTEEGSNQNGEGENSGGFNPTGNEESIDRFPSLNGTEWQVSRVLVSPDEGSETFSVVEISRTGKVKFAVNGDALSLVDGSGNTPYDAITGKFKDSAGNEITVPLIQSASGFKYINAGDWTHEATLSVSANGYRATAEHLQIFGEDTSLLELTFGITFTIADSNGVTHNYQSYIELLPSTGDDDDYGIGDDDDWVDVEAPTDKITPLDMTKWEVYIADLSEYNNGNEKNLEMVPNSLNAQTLTLSVADGTAITWIDSSGRDRTDPVTAKFINRAGQTMTVSFFELCYDLRKPKNSFADYQGTVPADGSSILIEVIGKYPPFSAVRFHRYFTIDGIMYHTYFRLKPVK